jgi:predicted MFS family arabinose efflux permease
MVLAVLLPYSLGVIAPAITRDLQIADSQFGLITGSVYLVAGLAAGWFGQISDRLDLRIVLVAAFALCTFSLASFSVVTSLVPAILLAAVGGCVLAVSNPISNLVVVRAFPPNRWGTLIGWKQSGVPIAAIVSGLGIAPLAELIGWRTSLLLVSALPLVALAFSLKRIPDHTLSASASPAGAGHRTRPGRPVNLVFLLIFSLLMGIGNGIITSYYVLYARIEVGASPTESAAVVVILGVVGTVVRVLGGRLLSLFRLEILLAALASIGIFSSLCVIAAAHMGLWLMYLGAVLAGTGALGWLTLAMMALASRPASSGLGQASGRVSQAFYVGLVTGPPLAGGVLALTGAYTSIWISQGFFYAIAVGASLVAWRQIRSDSD